MKIIIVCTVFIISAIAEPPVDNRYLPPQQGTNGGGGFGPPSQTYGPPNGGFGQQRQTDAVFGARPSSTYGAPNGGSSRRPSYQNGAPRAPSKQYGAPNAFQPSNQYIPPSQPSNQYGAPGVNTPSSQYGAPQFGAMSRQGGNGASRPDTQYGAPFEGTGFGGNQQGNGLGAQSRQYLPPGSNGNGYNGNGYNGNGYNGNGDGSNGEPANYSFEYMVQDDDSGNDFGHRESRQGDRAEGLYYVLLPDGRKQTVEYEADQDGYRPKISYEDTGAGAGGYGRGSQNGYQNGNQFGGPY